MKPILYILVILSGLILTSGVLSAGQMGSESSSVLATLTATPFPVATLTAVSGLTGSPFLDDPLGDLGIYPAPLETKITPQRGDIIAQTTEGEYILIKPNGIEAKIDKQTFHAFSRDPALAVDGSFHLVVAGRNVLNRDVSGKRAPGSVAHAESRKTLVEGLVAADIRNLYGVVVQSHREILLFEVVDPHHQGVGYIIPPGFVGIEGISFGANERTSDLLLVLRRVTGTPALFWLSPAAVYETAPHWVHQECHNARWRLHDCLMRYNRKMNKELIFVRENAFNAVVVW